MYLRDNECIFKIVVCTYMPALCEWALELYINFSVRISNIACSLHLQNFSTIWSYLCMVMVPTQTNKNLICTISASSCETCSTNTAIHFTICNSMKHVTIHAHLNISPCSACVNVEGVTWFTGASQFQYFFIITKMHITGFDYYCTTYVIALYWPFSLTHLGEYPQDQSIHLSLPRVFSITRADV